MKGANVVKNRILTSVFGVFVVMLLITFSICLPIYFRPFYYMQIEPLEIEEKTGYSKEEIIDSFDELMDYLTLPGKEFSTGVFKHSEDGESHFYDCKVIFTINTILFFISLAVVVTLLILEKKKLFKLCKPFGFSVLLTCGVVTISVFIILAILIFSNFDKAFKIFHQLFFPGKDNWLFNPRKDQIIYALPEQFFANCAILIASSIILGCIIFIVYSIIKKKTESKKRSLENNTKE